MMMMMVLVVFDSGAGLRVMGGDGDISSSFYPPDQTDKQNTTEQNRTPTQPISTVRESGEEKQTEVHRERIIYLLSTRNLIFTEH